PCLVQDFNFHNCLKSDHKLYLNQESRLPPGSDFRRWVWITIAPFVTQGSGYAFPHASILSGIAMSHFYFLVLHAVKQGFIFGDAKVRTRHINHRFSPYHTPSQNTSCEGLFYVVAKKKPLCLKEGLYVSKKIPGVIHLRKFQTNHKMEHRQCPEVKECSD
ncbi:hypothetical protein L325_0125250, partial (plasmid) [Yersinia pestis 9]